MKQHPILFSTPMVQAILQGNKTQTRRIKNLNQVNECPEKWNFKEMDTIITLNNKHIHGAIFSLNETSHRIINGCPYGNLGDILWVRETWKNNNFPQCGGYYEYKADCDYPEAKFNKGIWKPSIHMPKSACRIWLLITDIRVERLQSISEQDAIAEGAMTLTPSDNLPAIVRYHMLWDIINGPDSWTQNPWVWVIEFKRVEKPC